jgi:hypothetical protein
VAGDGAALSGCKSELSQTATQSTGLCSPFVAGLTAGQDTQLRSGANNADIRDAVATRDGVSGGLVM